jgi:hypothetical protein
MMQPFEGFTGHTSGKSTPPLDKNFTRRDHGARVRNHQTMLIPA